MSEQREIIVIPDVHGRDFWRDAVANRGDREVIFLGDYVDPYDWEQISDEQTLAGLKDIVQLKQDNPEDITLLLGNHDLQYVYRGFPYARYCRKNAFMYFDAFWDHRELFDLAAVRTLGDKRFIFSHAGIQPWWLQEWHELFGLPEFEREQFGDMLQCLDVGTINDLYHRGKDEIVPALEQISRYRGGWNIYGSLVWSDLKEYSTYPENTANTFQVFGHTQRMNGPYISDNYACLDCRKAFCIREQGIF